MRWTLLLAVMLVSCGKSEPVAKSYPVAAPQPVAAPEAPSGAAEPAAAVPTGSAPGRAAGGPGEPADPAAVKAAVQTYFNQTGRFPSTWQEMIQQRILRQVPVGKNGLPLKFSEYAEFQARQP